MIMTMMMVVMMTMHHHDVVGEAAACQRRVSQHPGWNRSKTAEVEEVEEEEAELRKVDGETSMQCKNVTQCD